jgi:hypothetical protein
MAYFCHRDPAMVSLLAAVQERRPVGFGFSLADYAAFRQGAM